MTDDQKSFGVTDAEWLTIAHLASRVLTGRCKWLRMTAWGLFLTAIPNLDTIWHKGLKPFLQMWLY